MSKLKEDHQITQITSGHRHRKCVISLSLTIRSEQFETNNSNKARLNRNLTKISQKNQSHLSYFT